MSLNATDQTFIDELRAHLPDDTIREAEARHLEEPRGKWRGISRWVALPRTVEDVSTIVGACHKARVGLVPYGGGTGLVGGQVMPDGPAPLLI